MFLGFLADFKGFLGQISEFWAFLGQIWDFWAFSDFLGFLRFLGTVLGGPKLIKNVIFGVKKWSKIRFLEVGKRSFLL